MTPIEDLRKSHSVQSKVVKAGDLMAFIYWAKVKTVQDDGEVLDVEDVDSMMGGFHVRGKSLVEKGLSASQYHETVKVTKTQAAELLVSSHNRPLTVVFLKHHYPIHEAS